MNNYAPFNVRRALEKNGIYYGYHFKRGVVTWIPMQVLTRNKLII